MIAQIKLPAKCIRSKKLSPLSSNTKTEYHSTLGQPTVERFPPLKIPFKSPTKLFQTKQNFLHADATDQKAEMTLHVCNADFFIQ